MSGLRILALCAGAALGAWAMVAGSLPGLACAGLALAAAAFCASTPLGTAAGLAIGAGVWGAGWSRARPLGSVAASEWALMLALLAAAVAGGAVTAAASRRSKGAGLLVASLAAIVVAVGGAAVRDTVTDLEAHGGRQVVGPCAGAARRWSDAPARPPPSSSPALYLGPRYALAAAPAEEGGADTYRVAPTTPSGERSRWATYVSLGGVHIGDGGAQQARRLSYSSEPIRGDTEITGSPAVILWLRASAAGTQVSVYLEDVAPDGHITCVTEGQLLLAHRATTMPGHRTPGAQHSFRRGDVLPPPAQVPEEVRIDLLPISYLLRAGHRPRLSITGANAGDIEPPSAGEHDLVIHHGGLTPSRIILPLGATAAALPAAPGAPVPPLALPAPDGPHAIGVRDFVIEAKDRPEPFSPRADEHRRLVARLWYPAQGAAVSRTRPYRTPQEAMIIGRPLAQTLHLSPVAFDRLSEGATHGIAGAPLAPGVDRAPLVVFSPGYYGWLDTNTALAERLASRGVAVLSLGRPHESSATLFPDGTVLPLHPSAVERRPPEITSALMAAHTTPTWGGVVAAYQKAYGASWRLTQSAPIWRDDMVSAASALLSGAAPPEVKDVAAHLDAGRLAYVGMSFGGAAAVAACESDVRCRASINMDGRDYGLALMNKAVRAPLLMLYEDLPAALRGRGRMYNDLDYERWSEAGTDPRVRRFIVEGAGHWDFTDYTLAGGTSEALPSGVLGPGHGPALLDRINKLIVGFLAAHGIGPGDLDFDQLVAQTPGLQEQDLSDLRAWAARERR